MRHRSQLVECQKSRRTFNGMNRPENAGQNLPVVGILLQLQQLPVQTVEIFIALDQKLFDNVVGIVHGDTFSIGAFVLPLISRPSAIRKSLPAGFAPMPLSRINGF